MPDLSRLNLGDHVAIPSDPRSRYDPKPHITHRIYKVTSKSPTQMRVTNVANASVVERVRQADGAVIGGRLWHVAVEATPEIIERYNAQVATHNRYVSALKALSDLLGHEQHQLRLTTEQLERLAQAWAEVKAMAEPTTPTATAVTITTT